MSAAPAPDDDGCLGGGEASAACDPAGDGDPLSEDEAPGASRWGELVAEHLLRGPSDLASRATAAMWLVAAVARIGLLEPRHGAAWWTFTALHIVGALLVAARGARLGWALSLVGLGVPYIFLRDWMTQTWVQLLIASVGAATASARDDGTRVRAAAVALCALTYAASAFHKLNAGFFDAEISCATYGWDKLGGYFDAALPFDAAFRRHGAATIVSIEALLALGLLWRPAAAAPLAMLFHVPLTLVLAPAFVFVMAIGLVAALPAETLGAVLGRLRGWRGVLMAITAALMVAVTVRLGEPLNAPWLLRLFVLYGLLLASLAVAAVAWRARAPRLGRPVVVAVAVLFVLNATTPYLGTQTQHTGAMLSNLRVDDGCWNHLLVPEGIRRVDPYVRIDAASVDRTLHERAVAPPAHAHPHARREATLEQTLWVPSQLRILRRNWCNGSTRPIALRGTFRRAPLDVADLCAPDAPLPRGLGLLGNPELLPGFLKTQKNLSRTCRAACVH